VKYAPQSSISISVNTFSETYVQMIFEDQGTGIPKEHLPFIFDRFYRVPEQPGKAGTGLGLFICNQIIEAHHGKIWAESEEQKGTRFIIQLPTQ